jgi:hypothetical protein
VAHGVGEVSVKLLGSDYVWPPSLPFLPVAPALPQGNRKEEYILGDTPGPMGCGR